MIVPEQGLWGLIGASPSMRRAFELIQLAAGRALIQHGIAAGDEVAIRGVTLLDNRLALLP